MLRVWGLGDQKDNIIENQGPSWAPSNIKYISNGDLDVYEKYLPTNLNGKSKPKKNDTVTPSTKEISELPALPLLGSVEQGGRKENIARIDSFLQKEINNKTEHQIILEQKPAPSKENVVSVFTPKQNKAIQENAPNKESSVKIHWAKLILFYLSVFSLIYICFLSWKHRKKIYSLLKNKKKTYSLLTKRASR